MMDIGTDDSLTIEVNIDALYQEDIFTDLGAATIRRLRPVTKEGIPDHNRRVEYIAETTLATQFGTLPLQARIEASSLEEAFSKLGDAMQQEINQLQERAQQMKRDDSSRIVVPTAVPPGIPSAAGLGVGGAPASKSKLIFGK